LNVVRKLREKAMGAILAHLVKKLAEGDFGAGPAKAYWWLAGKKTLTGTIGVAAAGALWALGEAGLCDPCGGYVLQLGAVSLLLMQIGLWDAAIRIEPPARPRDTVGTRR
jgi:hypothetical protein